MFCVKVKICQNVAIKEYLEIIVGQQRNGQGFAAGPFSPATSPQLLGPSDSWTSATHPNRSEPQIFRHGKFPNWRNGRIIAIYRFLCILRSNTSSIVAARLLRTRSSKTWRSAQQSKKSVKRWRESYGWCNLAITSSRSTSRCDVTTVSTKSSPDTALNIQSIAPPQKEVSFHHFFLRCSGLERNFLLLRNVDGISLEATRKWLFMGENLEKFQRSWKTRIQSKKE